MERERVTIIVPTHDSYLDLFAVFAELFRKNWADCPYRLVLSCNEYPAAEEYPSYCVVNNPADDLILARVRNAALAYPAKYYLILLEDMFIDRPVYGGRFEEVLDFAEQNGLHYCNLSNFKPAKRNKFVFPSKAMPYGISFGAFLCDDAFIDAHFSRNISGWDFENEQLRLTLQHKKREKFTDCAHCNGNPLNIVHGISKGKWIRSAKRTIQKHNPEIDLGGRQLLSRGETFKNKMYSAAQVFGPRSRARLKRLLRHFGFKFTTDF